MERMFPGVYITNNQLQFVEFNIKDIGQSKFCSSFSLPVDHIAFIGVCPKIIMDDEVLFIIIVDKQNKIYPIPDLIFKTESYHQLEDHFKLPNLLNEWEKLTYQDHLKSLSKVIYPSCHYGKSLFKPKNWFQTQKFFLNGWSYYKGKVNTDLVKSL